MFVKEGSAIRRPLIFMAAAQACGIFVVYWGCGVRWDETCFWYAGASQSLFGGVLNAGCVALVIAVFVILLVLWRIGCRSKRCRPWNGIVIIFYIIGVLETYTALQWDISNVIPEITSGKVSVTIEGVVEKVRSGSGTSSIVLEKCLLKNPENENYEASIGKILVYVLAPDVMEGDRVLVEGQLSQFDSAKNFGEFDSKKYYKSHGINAKCTGKTVTVLENSQNRILTSIFKLKAKLVAVCGELTDESCAGVIMSVAFGDKSELDGDIQGLYQRSGIAHILAISGLHISMVGMVVFGLLRALGLGITESAVISIATILGYGTMTGSATSSIRAVCMFSISVNAKVVGRKYDMLTAAGLSSMLILLEYPLLLFDSGFLLSFGAVIGIALVFPVLRGCLKLRDDTLASLLVARLVDSVLVSASVSLVTIPVLLCSFHEFPLYSLLLNLIVIPMMGLIMACSLGGCLVGLVFARGGRFLFGTVHYLLAVVSNACGLVSNFPLARLTPGDLTGWRLAAYYALLACMLVAVGNVGIFGNVVNGFANALKHIMCFANDDTGGVNYKKLKDKDDDIRIYICRGVLALVFVTALLLTVFCRPVTSLQVRMLSVGQGDGILVRLPGGTAVLVDGGSSDNGSLGKYVLAPCIKASGVNMLDYVFVSHADSDHISGIKYLVENRENTGISIGTLVVAAGAVKDSTLGELTDLCIDNGVRVAFAREDMELSGKDGGWLFRLLYPNEGLVTTDRNAASMVLRLEYGDFSMLFMGDLGSDGEERLVNEMGGLLDCDVLKVAHHGSRYSSCENFLGAVSPQYAVISCGDGNSYGHPHSETLERLADAGASIAITADGGEIDITSGGKGYKVTRPAQ